MKFFFDKPDDKPTLVAHNGKGLEIHHNIPRVSNDSKFSDQKGEDVHNKAYIEEAFYDGVYIANLALFLDFLIEL